MIIKRMLNLDINDDFKRAIIAQFFLMILVFVISILSAVEDKVFFQISYLVELLIIGFGFRFYFQAQKNRNYSFWTITLVVFIYLLFDVLKYTFVDYNILILYVCFLALIFLSINCYIMSSPLFFPRVQWWEYDFRFRGDLKSIVHTDSEQFKSRLTDVRRYSACIECFEFLPIDKKINIEVNFDNKNFNLPVIVKTSDRVVVGRPFRYGVKMDIEKEETKEKYLELLKIWNSNKKAKLRNKFTENEK